MFYVCLEDKDSEISLFICLIPWVSLLSVQVSGPVLDRRWQIPPY